MSREKTVTQELNRFLNKRVRVRLQGGREVIGLLKGFDAVVNIVLEDTYETIRDSQGCYLDKRRFLGLIVAKGTAVVLISLEDGTQSIENPFISDGWEAE